MLFNSIGFLAFFPAVVLLYYIIPNKIKMFWLLIASYFFYMCWNAKYALLLLTSTVVTYLSGLLIERIKRSDYEIKKQIVLKKLVVILSLTINLGLLFYFKYANFAINTITLLFRYFHINLNTSNIDIILPVGISFFTFQALGYTIDVYRDEIYAEKNFFRYALFVSFFPQLVAGPIERSKNLIKQLAVPQKFSFDNLREGFLLMLWGYFLKIVLADRIAMFVDTVYGDINLYQGMYLIIATLLFSIQILCDFAGYSTIAMGAAKILGIQLQDNFNAPYLAFSVSDFWRRWHISLTSWFKDYLYIPLGGSRKGKFRKYLNKMIVFLVSGLWHGAGLSFIVWGGLNGLYQIIEEVLRPIKEKLIKVLKIKEQSFILKLTGLLITFFLVSFSWIFFRSNSLMKSIDIIKSVFTINNYSVLLDGSLFQCGVDAKNFFVIIISILILLFADICKTKGIIIREFIIRKQMWFRVLLVSFSIVAILIFGIWGAEYDQASFIYFQF